MENSFTLMLQTALVLLIAPLFSGIIKKIKALSQKRVGPPVIQGYFDLIKLFQKGTVISTNASWITRVVPAVVFAASLYAAVTVPYLAGRGPHPLGDDLVLAVYTLALARIFMTLAGMDGASAFGGLGGSRDYLVAALFEPALLVSVITLGLITGTTSAQGIQAWMATVGNPATQPGMVLLSAAVFVVLIAETSRIPVDDPDTHLELTMVHEAMLLDYSGPHLALLEWGASLKQLFLIALLANLFIPGGPELIPWAGAAAPLLVFMVKGMLIAVATGIWEASTVKLRLFSISNLAAASFMLAFIGFLNCLSAVRGF